MQRNFLLLLVLSIVFCISLNVYAQDDDTSFLEFTGGTAKCTFNGRVPFKRVLALNNNLVISHSNGTIELLIFSQATNANNQTNARFFTSLETLSNPEIILEGDKVNFTSGTFDLELTKKRVTDMRTVEITNELLESDDVDVDEKTSAKGYVQITNFDENIASGKIRATFKNTLRTIKVQDEEVQSNENGKAIVRCTFEDVPVFIQGDI